MTRRPVLVLAAALAVVMRAAPSSGCSTFLAGARATSDGSLFVTHSDDGEGNPDVRLSYVPVRSRRMNPTWIDERASRLNE